MYPGRKDKAIATKLGREVAIKVLPSEVTGDSERLARFQREAHLLASLNHPNIAAIHGLEEVDGRRERGQGVPCSGRCLTYVRHPPYGQG